MSEFNAIRRKIHACLVVVEHPPMGGTETLKAKLKQKQKLKLKLKLARH